MDNMCIVHFMELSQYLHEEHEQNWSHQGLEK